jgi:hypothetical protein
MIEIQSENMIIRGLLSPFSSIDPRRIIGSIGRTQGARTVRSPARNERISKSIKKRYKIIYFIS